MIACEVHHGDHTAAFCPPLALCHLISQAFALPLAVGIAVQRYTLVQGPVLLWYGIARSSNRMVAELMAEVAAPSQH